ncbi:MAG: amidophosphoribosyltransferase [Rhodothermales bacterium]|nr:amidophosphoribosyltransferase [Rhodothermales bacterium]MCA0268693.1 amidophosphoribosyltransferase [Bacteroidota bacterium]
MRQHRDACGVFGVFGAPNAARIAYYGLHALQHRGQESAGIATATYDERRQKPVMPVVKDFGLVLDVFADRRIFDETLLGDRAVGHVRYSTTGAADNLQNVQPFVVHDRMGNVALAHNGNLSNARELRRSFQERGTLFSSSTDSELLLHLIAQSRRARRVDQVIDALTQVEGAFSLAILTDDALIAVRDPNGFRPLALGRMKGKNGQPGAFVVASETCAFDLVGADFVRDVAPGEILVVDAEALETGEPHSYRLASRFGVSQCVFEYVYFSRPDSKVFGEMVDKVRRKIGKALAHDAPVPRVPEGDKRPIVMAVPDSSNTAAIGYASECEKLGFPCKFDIGLIRNHYVGRTFISPGQDQREIKVRTKFNTVEGVLKDRVVVMLDDSIVRGTTARQLVKMVRDAGAKEVHFRVASPPVLHPCFYGMDFPSHDELLANQFDDVDEMAAWLGVDSLAYLSVEGMMQAVHVANPDAQAQGRGFCNACFSGVYPVPVDEGVTKDEYDG